MEEKGKIMLNIEKFQNNFKVTIQGGLRTVHEWTENGEGDYCFSTGMEYYNGSFDVDINNIQTIGRKIIEHINKSNCSSFNYEESDLTIIDNRISFNQIEDVDCNIIETVSERQVEENLYICDYDVFVSINGIELSEEELKEILPEAN